MQADPLGLGAADPTNPQSLNRFSQAWQYLSPKIQIDTRIKNLIRVISARDMSRKERKIYQEL